MLETFTLKSTLKTFYSPFKLLGVPIGKRMTAITCISNKVWVHSPIELNDASIQLLRNMGNITWVICPNLFHYLHVNAFQNIFPECQLFGVNGIEKKVKHCTFQSLEDERSSQLWNSDIQQHNIKGASKISEVVFFHQETKTLILTDLVFNLSHSTIWASCLMRLNGAHNKCTTTRVFKSMIEDKILFK